MNRTRIEYLDYTWNPIVGCSGVGCAVREHCWARAQAKRQKHVCPDCYAFTPHYHFERFAQPLRVRKPARIGVGFMGDLFDSAFNIGFHQLLFKIMAEAAWHTFLCLTKQAANMLNFTEAWVDIPENVWLGVSVNCKADLWRIDKLREIDVAVRFVSFEPLLEDVCPVNLDGIDWIIIGGQTRPRVIPNGAWIDYLMYKSRDIPVFLKNNLPHHECQQLPKGLEVRSN